MLDDNGKLARKKQTIRSTVIYSSLNCEKRRKILSKKEREIYYSFRKIQIYPLETITIGYFHVWKSQLLKLSLIKKI